MPAGRVLLAQGQSDWGTNYAAGSTGGEATHQLTVGELPSHSHTASSNTTGNHSHTFSINVAYHEQFFPYADSISRGENKQGITSITSNPNGNHSHSITINNTGSNQPHNNLQPYISVYMWQRIS